MTMSGEYLTNQLLVAMPALGDPNFAHTVTLVCEHTKDGALGIVINRPMEMAVSEVFEQLDLATQDLKLRDQRVLRGGPVAPERGFVLHPPSHAGTPTYDATLKVSPELHVTTSRDVLAAIARGEGPHQALVALGYAGWGAGQLEEEIRSNAWLNVPMDSAILFETPFQERWRAAMKLLGVDSERLSSQTGHA
jgi:putative transcriptional regulator